jgi:hypothetical protein
MANPLPLSATKNKQVVCTSVYQPDPFYSAFDVGRSDHLTPFLCLLDDNLVEFGRRARKRRGAKITEPRRNLWIGQPRIDLLVELIDDFDRSVPRSSDPDPRAGFKAWLELGKGRNLR